MNLPSDSFLFRGWPYLSVVLCVAGLTLRFLLTSDRLPAVKRRLPQGKRVFLAGRLWIAAGALLAAGHLVPLLFPQTVLGWNRRPWHLLALEAAGFVAGLMAAAVCVRSVWLHLQRAPRQRRSLPSDVADSALLALLFIGVASGLTMAVVFRWASAWAAVTVAPWTASLIHGRPEPAFVEHLPLLVRLHLFAAFGAVAVFPASRLGAFPIVAAHRALGAVQRASAAVAAPVGAWLRRGLVSALWPEPEIRWLSQAAEAPRRQRRKTPLWWPRLGRDARAATEQSEAKAPK